ncbi:MAG: TonB-dependent receptor domain-containing protein, partial [Burkholderiales bacterium]
FEKDWMGRENLSPRIALNFHATPENTFRAGISVAYRTPSLVETNLPGVQPGSLFVPNALPTSPNLMPEKMVSREIGYLGEFPEWKTTLDLRAYDDFLGNGIFYDKPVAAMANGFSAEYRGMEATLKMAFNDDKDLLANFAHQTPKSNGPALVAAGYSGLKAVYSPGTFGSSDILTESVPKNSASLLYSQRLIHDISYSIAYYFQDSMQPFDRNYIDFQPTQHRIDLRVAKAFRFADGVNGDLALVVQNLLQPDAYTEYIASNLFNRRAYVKLTVNW